MTYVDPFLGAGAVWLSLLDASLVPLVSWMGGKRRLAPRILDRLGLASGRILLGSRVGEVPPCLLGDASWWGWVWPVCLDADTGPRVSAILRSWRGEDPRALWFRLRAAGPMEDRTEAAAQLLWLQARAASGVPVWWEGGDAGDVWRGTGYNFGQRVRNERARVAREEAPPRNGRSSSVPGSGADVGRLVKTNTAGDAIEDGCCKGNNERGAGGIVDPGTIAGRLDAIRASLTRSPVIEHRGARELTEDWAHRIGSNGRVYLDPPYQGATGYPAVCPRDEVLWIAEEWARHGARVVLSEACGLAAELGSGWIEEQLPSTRKPEWITVYDPCTAHRPGV